jgi:hypothetical protein
MGQAVGAVKRRHPAQVATARYEPYWATNSISATATPKITTLKMSKDASFVMARRL